MWDLNPSHLIQQPNVLTTRPWHLYWLKVFNIDKIFFKFNKCVKKLKILADVGFEPQLPDSAIQCANH